MTIELNGKVTTINELSGIIDTQTTIRGGIALGGTIIGSAIAERGLKGEKGDKGDKGDQGERGEAGTKDYSELENRPQIEGVTLDGNKSFADLSLEYLTNLEIEAMLG